MQTSFFSQGIKILLLILLISAVFWWLNHQPSEVPSSTTQAEQTETNSNKTAISHPQDSAINSDPLNINPNATSPELSIDQSLPQGMNMIPAEDIDLEIMGTEPDLSNMDLGGINSIPTEEERQEMMQYAPGFSNQEPPTAAELDAMMSEGPGATPSEGTGIAPEDSQP